MGAFSHKRSILIVTACLAIAVLSADFFAATHVDHDHTGADCSVCLLIQTAQDAIKGFGLVFIAVHLLSLARNTHLALRRVHHYAVCLITPITLRVQSNT
jgi:hypothetical protein